MRIPTLAALALLPGCSSPEPAPPRPFEFECRWAAGTIAIDGAADEADWKHAHVIDRFRVPWAGKEALTATRARLLWDRENLYFFADLDDGDLFADVVEHDGKTWNNDVFELFFKPAPDRTAYYEFQVNAANTGLDMLLRPGAGGFDKLRADGDFSMTHAVRLRGTLNVRSDRDRGWSVEGRIPWRDFLRTGGRPNPGERWTMNLSRYDYDVAWEKPDLSTCAPLTQPSFHRLEDFAGLTFVGPPPAPRTLLTTSRVAGSPDPPLPYRAVRAYPRLPLSCVLAVAPEPGTGRLLFIEQKNTWGPSALRRMKDDPEAAEAETLLSQDGTAYGMAFRDGHLYLGWNGPQSKPPRKTRVSRFVLQPAFDPKSEKTVIEWDSDGHNGGDLAFGPDGMLYVTSGDGTSDSDTNVTGQDLTKLLAKVLRIDVGADPYRVPRDNPFLATPGARPETWAYGFRNPWRIHIDLPTGRVFVGNNGQDLWEQMYLVERGANYGWSVTEGSHPFYPGRTPGPTPISKPAAEHPHSESRSLTGGLVYRGTRLPELSGAYLYGDYSTGKIWAWRDGRSREIADTPLAISGFGLDTKGELLVCDHRPDGKGGFYTLEPTSPAPGAEFPRTLSASGLFRSVKGHVMEPALVPYAVNSPLWSDGARKERWIAVPGDGKIDFTTSRGWNFPDGAVLVKSFALGDRWIETRFLTRQEGEWVGYSYEWNDAQTEGTLVDAAGKDRNYGAQTWHYPSRAECMVCHSRAANFVLGLTELQMNRDGQLEALERRGLLKVDWAAAAREELKDVAKAKGLKDKEADDYAGRHAPLKDQRPAAPSALLAKRPESYRRLADPYDAKGDPDSRARSYLHANCAHCHVEAGGGNAQMELEATTARDKMRLIDVKPVHHTDGIEDARLVAPGSPERSMLLRRLARRGPGQMPPLASSLPDEPAARLIEAWIRSLK